MTIDFSRIKARLLQEAKEMDELNATIPVQGKRIAVQFEDRTVHTVYYQAASPNAPIMFAMYGGGFLFGGCALDDNMWAELCAQWDVNIVSIGYRKSPGYPHPTPLLDVYDTIKYFLTQDTGLDFDKDRVWVYGCSAGGNLAAGVCLYMKQRGEKIIDKQILIYPFLDNATTPEEKGSTGDELPLYSFFNELHIAPEHARDVLASPVFATKDELAGLPEAYFVIAGKDSLMHEAERYAKMLEEANVTVHSFISADMPHGFVENSYANLDERYCPDDVRKLWEDGILSIESEKAMAWLKAELFPA